MNVSYTLTSAGYSSQTSRGWVINTKTLIQGSSQNFSTYYGVAFYDFAAFRTQGVTHKPISITMTLAPNGSWDANVQLYMGGGMPKDVFTYGSRPTAMVSPQTVFVDRGESAVFHITDPSWLDALLNTETTCFYIYAGNNISEYWECKVESLVIDWQTRLSAPLNVTLSDLSPYQGNTLTATCTRPESYTDSVTSITYRGYINGVMCGSVTESVNTEAISFAVTAPSPGAGNLSTTFYIVPSDQDSNVGESSAPITVTLQRFTVPVVRVNTYSRPLGELRLDIEVIDTGYGGTMASTQIGGVEIQINGGAWTAANIGSWVGLRNVITVDNVLDNLRYSVGVRVYNVAPAGLTTQYSAAYVQSVTEAIPALYPHYDSGTGSTAVGAQAVIIAEDYSTVTTPPGTIYVQNGGTIGGTLTVNNLVVNGSGGGGGSASVVSVTANTDIELPLEDGQSVALFFVASSTSAGDILMRINGNAPTTASYTYYGGGGYGGGIVGRSGSSNNGTSQGILMFGGGSVQYSGIGRRGDTSGGVLGWFTANWDNVTAITTVRYSQPGTLVIQPI